MNVPARIGASKEQIIQLEQEDSMKTKMIYVVTIALCLATTALGLIFGRSLGTAANEKAGVPAVFVGVPQYTLYQETRNTSGELAATELRAYDNGKYYYRHTAVATGRSAITLLTDSGGYMNNKDESDPNRLVKIREAGNLMLIPSALLLPSGWISKPGFQRFDYYKDQVVAVLKDEIGEQWVAPMFSPSPLRTVRDGAVTETVKIEIGKPDQSLFEVSGN